jgi:hypothetical protein
MTRKTYKTALGKTVDLGALMLQNEDTRAVGNMKVNARGDLVDGWNRPIDNRTQQVKKQYDRQVTNVRDEPVPMSAASSVTAVEDQEKTQLAKDKAAKTVKPVPQESQGLAAAIARARQFKQETDTNNDDNKGPRRI